MDYAATQIYEEEDFECTQRISQAFEEKELIQVGVLSIDSTEYQIKKGTTTIGRLSTCDICINDGTVSKIHAEIEADAGQGSTWISDLLSANKTKLNNSVLRPKRLYELKDGSAIEFGKVRAIYRTYHPKDNIVIPETPAPARQRIAGTIVPNTPDSSIDNSSTANDDGSVVLGTQTEEEKSVFRRPLFPQQRQSTNIEKRNSSRGASMNENDDSQIDIRLRVSANDNSESEGVSIFDVETQKYEKGHKTVASSSIHDMETQNILTNVSKRLESNVKVKQPLSAISPRDKVVAGSSAIDISDMETQSYTDSDEQQRKSKADISSTTAKKFTTNIHDLETQNYIDTQNATTKKSMTSIHDLETQNYIDGATKSNTNIRDAAANKSMTNIHDLETQNYLVDIAKNNAGTRKLGSNKNKARTADVDQAERDIHDLETQKFGNERAVEDICDMETQVSLDRNESSNCRVDKNNEKNKDTPDAAKSATNYENATKLPSSRSSTPVLSLDLSSQEIDENRPSSPLNESVHLLESSDLMEYFADGIDKSKECITSTPKPCSKTSSQKDNTGNADNADNDNQEDNIHDLPTQCIRDKLKSFSSDDSETDEEKTIVKRKAPRKRHEKPRPTPINDDSETDAEEYVKELARKQGGSSEAPSKSRDANVEKDNDPGTSADSDDMFDMPTQRSKNHSAKNTPSLPINQQSKTNQTEAVVDDMVPTQKINVEDKRDRDDRSDVDIDDMAPTQPLLPRKAPQKSAVSSKKSLPGNNQNDVDDTVPTQIINVSRSDNRCTSPNLDSEDIDYETAPTQVIGEVAEKRHSTSKSSDHAKAAKSSKVDLNDTLERDLKEMFDDANSDSIHEHALMSTQCLEDILQSSQGDTDLLPNKSTVEEKTPAGNAPQAKSGKRSNQCSRNAMDSDENKNASEIDSQNSDIYFATITTRRKRNVIKDTPDITDCTEDGTSTDKVPDIPRSSKKKTKDDNSVTKANKKGKRTAESESKTDATMDDLIDNAGSKTVSSENNERITRRTKSVKQEHGTASETNKQIVKEDSREGDRVEENLASSLDSCAPRPSESKQDAQRLDMLYENEDDILSRLPAVRISGTLSNPPSPSASSISSLCSVKSKRDDAKDIKKSEPPKSKSICTRSVEILRRADNKLPLLSRANHSSSGTPKTLKINKILEDTNDSEDSDSATSYRRFKQMADRMLGKVWDHLEKRDKGSKAVQGASRSSPNKKKIAHFSPDVSKDSKQSFDLEESRNPVQTSLRTTRSSNRQDNESSCVQLTKAARAEDATDKSTKPGTKSTAASRKRGLNAAEESAEQTNSKKHKVDIVIGEAAKVSSRETRETSDIKTEHIDAAKSSFTRTRRKAADNSQAATRIENKSKRIQAKGRETLASQVAEKIPKIIIDSVDNESREVEMIMMRNIPSDVRDENSSVRERRSARIFQREFSSRSTRSRKRANTNAATDSFSTEENSFSSSGTSDLESMQSGSIAPTRTKRVRSAKNSPAKSPLKVPPPQETRASENEVFKRPTRINRYSASFTGNTTIYNSMSDDNRNSTQSDGPLNIRFSRSKTANTKNTWKVEMNERSRKERMANASVCSEINTSVDSSTFRVSTPPRARRSASSMSISSPSAARYRILFTGITEVKYDNVVRTLGGSKVETPKLCTVLVTDKVRRTYKFLCALAKGIPIVSINWLHDSESAAQFLDWEGYILKDRIAEAKFGFRLRKSLDKAKEKGLLVGYTIVLTPNIVQPPTKELRDMITSCGGKALLSPPSTWPEKAIIISHEQDLPNAKKYLAKAPKTVTVYTTEFILISILRQEVDFGKHRLI